MGSVLDIPQTEAMASMSARERVELLHQLLQAQAETAVGIATLLNEVHRTGEFRDDGHRSIKSFYLAHADDDGESATVLMGLMRLLRGMPKVGDAVNDGAMTLAQARALGAVHRNPRVRDALHDMEDEMLAEAEVSDLAGFTRVVQEFLELADADGAERKAEFVHENRRAHLSAVGDGFRGDHSCGAAQGVVMQKVLEDFADREFQADCADAKARVGEKYTPADLARTASQRRLDALHAIHVAAAAHQAGDRTPEPLVNLVVDVRTAQEMIEYAAAGVRPAPDFTNLSSRRCETSDGVRIPRSDALAAMLTGHVRRVVVDGVGVTIDLGRKRRLFTGGSRDAVMLRNSTCVWAGCQVPASRCEADHLDPFGRGGQTNADSGCPCCGKHNRWKTRGFDIRQDQHGRWRTYRPDGTSINAPPAA